MNNVVYETTGMQSIVKKIFIWEPGERWAVGDAANLTPKKKK